MMPSGKKFKNGYATVGENCLKYREIAEICTAEGDKMNHSTARNIFLSAMKKICEPIYKEISRDMGISEDEIYRNPDFQAGISQLIEEHFRDQINV
jgi:hypothetical protein